MEGTVMSEDAISYALFTRGASASGAQECFELHVEKTRQGYALVRKLGEQSPDCGSPVRTETPYCELGDALADFEATVACLSMEGSYRLRALSHADTVFNGPDASLAAAY